MFSLISQLKIPYLFLLAAISLSLSLRANENGRLLFLAGRGHHQEAAALYKQIKNNQGKDNFELLEEFSLSILQHGIISKDPETMVRTLYGASVSLNDKAERFFDIAYHSGCPQVQLAALNLISQSRSETSYLLLQQALGNLEPLIRLEAAFFLAKRKAMGASYKIEAMMQKLDPETWVLFPQIFTLIGDKNSFLVLRKFLAHPIEDVRAQTLLAIAESHHDNLLLDVRKCLHHSDVPTKECAAFALGIFKDEASQDQLKNMVLCSHPALILSASFALLKMNHKEYLPTLESLAENGDLFAIHSLQEFPGSEDILAALLSSENRNIRINACTSLLKLKDLRALKVLPEILLKDAKDLSFIAINTPGHAFSALKAVPSARQNLKDQPLMFELSLKIREEILEDALNLPQNKFLEVAKWIFDNEQTDLIPKTVELLINKNSNETIALLKKEEQHIGNPFIRSFACLALFRLRVDGNYEQKLKKWLLDEACLDIVKFRPFLPWELRPSLDSFTLTPSEKSSLFLSALEAFVTLEEDKGIDLMIDMIEKGCDKNRYVIAGLLLRASQ